MKLHILLCLALLASPVEPLWGGESAALGARHQALRGQLADNPFQRPLHLQSSQTADSLRGDIYVEVAQPFGLVGPALQGIGNWCDMLILHLNVKACYAAGPAADAMLRLHLGRKFDQSLAEAYAFEFRYRLAAAEPGYLRVELEAAHGPLATRDYRIVLEVLALDEQRSFLHLSYAYAYGALARIAMQGYLATVGRNKVGFSVVGVDADGQPRLQGNMRGVVERNAMRYYLAIEAYLGALALPAPARLEQRLQGWYAGAERYALQLHEMERAAYLAMKHREVLRQQALAQQAAAQ
ncbi:hypothetical protein AAFN46_02915 [Pseudomonas sp. CAU 1711]|uniref:hypothetical protein n=1 Tax=Pseudomonas sp. CAU 1711 TaxID=3140356 RepID=UPI003260156A